MGREAGLLCKAGFFLPDKVKKRSYVRAAYTIFFLLVSAQKISKLPSPGNGGSFEIFWAHALLTPAPICDILP